MSTDDVEIIVRRRKQPEPKSLKVSPPQEVKTKKEEPKEEGKTLFEHLGLAGGNKKEGPTWLSSIQKIVMQFFYFVVLGFILGLIVEMFYGFPAMIMALVFAFIWLMTVGKKYVFK